MMHIQRNVARVIDTAGEYVTFRAQLTGEYDPATGTLTKTERLFPVKAHVRSYNQKEISGLINYGDRELRVAATALGFMPQEGDFVQVGNAWLRVASIDRRAAGSSEVLYIMRVTGQ